MIGGNQNSLNEPVSNVPAGLEALHTACRSLYPEQPNPLQFNAVVKYWLGGPDPLDYISLYKNSGDPSNGIPSHWHYVSFGLSDLHGDGRVHEPTGSDGASGCGYELTIRVKCKENETSPPTWPATLMQGLASYIHKREANLVPGDHVTWHVALDQSTTGMKHMLILKDPQFPLVQTPFGSVEFRQIYGILYGELEAVQKWNGLGVLSIMERFPEMTGRLFITDIERQEDFYSFDPEVIDEIENGMIAEGSSLSGVSAKIVLQPYNFDVTKSPIESVDYCSLPVATNLENTDSLKLGKSQNMMQPDPSNPPRTPIENLHLVLNAEAGSLLPVALKGRLNHERHFTFQSVITNLAVTLVTPSVSGAFASSESPYTMALNWLQVLVSPQLLQKMIREFKCIEEEETCLPQTFEWSEEKLKITIVDDETSF